MRKRNIVIGILMIVFAVFGILEVSGAVAPIESGIGDISFAKVVAFMSLTVLIIISLSHYNWYTTVLLFALMFMTVEGNVAYMVGDADGELINNWALLAFAAIICIGLAFILPRGKHSKSVSGAGENNLGSYTEYIDCATFTKKRIENNLGRTEVRFDNVSEYKGGGELYVENNLGSMTVYVPNTWRVRVSIVNNLGGTKNRSNLTADGPELFIKGENNLGGIEITLI